MDKKTSLRIKSKEIRNNLDIKLISNIITENISRLDIFKNANNIMIFYPLENEINILGLLEYTDKNIFLPRMNGNSLECCPFVKGKLKKGKYNIQEPETECILCPNLDLIIVPALAADKKGNRLGYGGGFYDRYLAVNKGVKTIVPIPDSLLFEEIPTDKFDIRINYIVTEIKVYNTI